ncbi:DUF3347 domain-containing protein [Sediminibacterium soli]|uniref:DUF3347 domain-containing protein n=1 Tax=Sediminibacterium soli TaxID=2698829 RepID=UPI001379E84C|nr:DUF3347 domain-containing protein [Sediminibacterium soli]NCI46393.1 DUF3347 domain-containing protein [Sediminibacterium soli]
MSCKNIYLALGAVLLMAAACNSRNRQPSGTAVPAANGKSARSEAFNRSFGKLLSDYYALKEGFVSEDSDTTLNRLGYTLMAAADSLQLTELGADSALLANAVIYTEVVVAELKGLAGETGLEAKRKSFQMVSDQLYDLVRLVQYDRAVVYQQYCPMAFNDQGAAWLSSSPAVRNPYIPKKMPECGEIKDSIDFRPKQ